MTTDELTRSVRELQDRQSIYDCLLTYCRGVDRMDRELLLSSYHSDAVDDRGFMGRQSGTIADWAMKALRKSRSTTHIIANHSCELAGDVAHAETYLVSTVMPTDGTPVSILGGRYIDRFERRDGRWAIAARKMVIDWWTGDPPISPEMFNLAGPPRRDRSDPSYERPLVIAARECRNRHRQ